MPAESFTVICLLFTMRVVSEGSEAIAVSGMSITGRRVFLMSICILFYVIFSNSTVS